MNVKELEKLNELKEKGVITQEEFDKKKKEILAEDDEPKENKKSSFIKVSIIWSLIIVICFFIWALFNMEVNFACDETSMREAEGMINKAFPNWNNSFRLKNPTTVSQSGNSIKCKAETNIKDFAVVYYNLEKQENGEILITMNPLADAFNEAFGDFLNSL